MSLIQQPTEGIIKANEKIIGPGFMFQNPGMAVPLFNGIGRWQSIFASGSFFDPDIPFFKPLKYLLRHQMLSIMGLLNITFANDQHFTDQLKSQ